MEVKSTLNLHQFANAMKELDLSSVPEHRRKQAVAEHFFAVMVSTLADSNEKMAALRERAALAERARRRSDHGRTKDGLRLSTGGIILP
jgi:hypothetical protein